MTAELSPIPQIDRASYLHLVSGDFLKEKKYVQSTLSIKSSMEGYKPLIEPEYFQRVGYSPEKKAEEKTKYQQLFLPHLPTSFIEPDEYQREYTTEGGSTFYTTAVRYDSETGGMNPTGFGMIVAFGEFYDADDSVQPVTNATVHIGYKDYKADFVSVLTQDRERLAAFYETEGIAPVHPVAVFSGPFVKDTAYKAATGESLRHEGELLVIERVLFDEGSEKTSRREQITAPYVMDDQLVDLLRREGNSAQAEDSEHAFIHNRIQEHDGEEEVVFEVPQKYPVSFLSISNTD